VLRALVQQLPEPCDEVQAKTAWFEGHHLDISMQPVLLPVMSVIK